MLLYIVHVYYVVYNKNGPKFNIVKHDLKGGIVTSAFKFSMEIIIRIENYTS